MSRVCQLEGSQETTFREKEEFDKNLDEDLSDLKKEQVKLRGYCNQLNYKLEEFAKNSHPFN